MRFCIVLSGLVLTLLATAARGDIDIARHKPIVAGGLAINPYDIIAVFKPVDQQGVAIYVGRPGHEIQSIIIKDSKEAATVFGEIWDNQDVTKDPGDDDARPLTRMRLKDAERNSATLIANVNRLLAVVWGADRRHARVYLDKFIANQPLADPNGDEPMMALEIESQHDEAETVMAAYKACVYRKQ
jgi:hypothetical protein